MQSHIPRVESSFVCITIPSSSSSSSSSQDEARNKSINDDGIDDDKKVSSQMPSSIAHIDQKVGIKTD